MRYREYRDEERGEDVLVVAFSDYDLRRVNLDALRRAALNSPREFAIADRLMDAQMIAFALEQQAQAEDGGA